MHGGPAGTHSNTFSANRLYAWPLHAQAGFAVFFPNPRGSGGYGEKFRAANVRDWGGKDYEDIMTGVDALVERGLADKDRLAVCGWSYGGFMTSTIVTKTDRFKAAVVGAGVTHLSSFTGTTDIPDFARSYFSSWPWEDPQEYVEHSALMHVGKVKTPTLVVHGDKDDRVPVSPGLGVLHRPEEGGRAHRPPDPPPPAPRPARAEAAEGVREVAPGVDRQVHAGDGDDGGRRGKLNGPLIATRSGHGAWMRPPHRGLSCSFNRRCAKSCGNCVPEAEPEDWYMG